MYNRGANVTITSGGMNNQGGCVFWDDLVDDERNKILITTLSTARTNVKGTACIFVDLPITPPKVCNIVDRVGSAHSVDSGESNQNM